MRYFVEVKMLFGWRSLTEDSFGEKFADVAERRANELVRGGYNPRKVRVIRLVSTFKPKLELVREE